MPLPANAKLWESVYAFDLDHPKGDYSFSLRLAKENAWPKKFTEEAILEYKRFMYLAAIQDEMVSPSPIVDTVWHLHLLFTPSYEQFCSLLGKQIQHIPSTHQRSQQAAFQHAKEITTRHYEMNFGPQPETYWNYNNLYDSLKLETSSITIQRVLIVGCACLLALGIPAFYWLLPYYIGIEGNLFISYIVLLTLSLFGLLEVFNRLTLRYGLTKLDRRSWIFHLQPSELVYLKTNNVQSVVHGFINWLIVKGVLRIQPNHLLRALNDEDDLEDEYAAVVDIVRDKSDSDFWIVVKTIAEKPIFSNTKLAMDQLQKQLNQTKIFIFVFIVNFTAFAGITLLCSTRVAAGLLRDQATMNLIFLLIICLFFFSLYLHRLSLMQQKITIPRLYKREIVNEETSAGNWNWIYFLVGTAFFTSEMQAHARDSWFSNSGDGFSDGGDSGGDSGCGGCGGD